MSEEERTGKRVKNKSEEQGWKKKRKKEGREIAKIVHCQYPGCRNQHPKGRKGGRKSETRRNKREESKGIKVSNKEKG